MASMAGFRPSLSSLRDRSMAFVADASSGKDFVSVELEDTAFATATAADRNKDAACGKTYTQADEIQVTANDGALHRCVEFDGLLLTATGGGKEVAWVVAKDGGGALRVLSSESYLEARHQVHVVDVQGEGEAVVLLVVVRQEDARIVSILKLS